VAQVLGFESPWPLDGQSLFAQNRRAAPRSISGRPFDTGFADAAGPALERKLRLFGEGRSNLYPPGPYPELVGRPASALALRPPPIQCGVRFTYAQQYADVRPGRIPTYIKALADCAPRDVEAVAIAVNGTIVATTRGFAGIGQGAELGVMVPETAFRPGSNRVEAYLIEKGAGGDVTLRTFGRD
jgi:hypothetical protein